MRGAVIARGSLWKFDDEFYDRRFARSGAQRGPDRNYSWRETRETICGELFRRRERERRWRLVGSSGFIEIAVNKGNAARGRLARGEVVPAEAKDKEVKKEFVQICLQGQSCPYGRSSAQ